MARKFGIEIEAHGMSQNECIQLLAANGINVRLSAHYSHETSQQWKVVCDSSVGNSTDSFEVVSPPLSGQAGIDEVRKVAELLDEAGCYVSVRCGLHVHIEVQDLTPRHIANIHNRYRKHQLAIEKFMPPSRRNAHYAGRLTRDLQAQSTNSATCGQQCGRYHYVNMSAFAKYGTLEFRQHSGSLNRTKITNWIKFLLQFIDACTPTASTDPARTPVASMIRGKSAGIIRLLRQSSRGMTADDLSRELESSVPSIQSMICRLRNRHQINIHSRRGIYTLNTEARVDRRVAINAVNDTLWTGVDNNLQVYYGRRQQQLSRIS